jgi:hypothetical protein
VKLFRPVTYTYRSIPYSTECTCHLGWSFPPRLADAEERILIGSKWFASFNPRTFARRCGSRRRFRSRSRRRFRSGFRSGFRSRLRSGLGCGWGRPGERCRRGLRSGRFRYRRGRLTPLLDFHKLIRKGFAYHNSYVFILYHTVRN